MTDEENLKQLRFAMETQFKYVQYRRPEFRFLHSMGCHNIFQGFRSDKLDLGILHLYWDRDKENGIQYYDPNTGELRPSMKGEWCHRWYPPGTTSNELKPVNYHPEVQIDEAKLLNAHVTYIEEVKRKQDKRTAGERNPMSLEEIPELLN